MPTPYQPLPIEDYAMVGDCNTAALVGRNGSIDWLCWPRFDSDACLAALLGTDEHGRWLLQPAGEVTRVTRSYRDSGLVLETVFETPTGTVALIDFMVPEALNSTLIRIVEGRGGEVAMTMALSLRFDYGSSVPWVTRLDDTTIQAIAGPHMCLLRTELPTEGRDMQTVADFTIAAGQRVPMTLTYAASHMPAPSPIDAERMLTDTEAYWTAWSSRGSYKGEYEKEVALSLRVLKALTYHPTGGIVAAVTTSLPEKLGGNRNWDYRYCWLRDATITLFALMQSGYYEEAGEWRAWLHRSVAGSPDQIQIMYGLSGERRLAEWEVSWLPGYQGAAPVRVGNAASAQVQLDIYGELFQALHLARQGGLVDAPASWQLQCSIVEHLETIWQQPDEGIWETRGGRKQFVYSKVSVWVAFDRMVKDAEAHGLPGPKEHWAAVRDQIHADVCEKGFHKGKNSFVQHYDTDELDAALLLIPLTGFLPHTDPRVKSTTAAIERELMQDGFVLRYRTTGGSDGLPPGEGCFLPCSFWLVDNLHMQGRDEEAHSLFQRLLELCNDVGLLSEEYDPESKRLTGNFPQAFTHVALVSSAMNLAIDCPAQAREAASADS